MMTKTKKILTVISIAFILLIGLYCSAAMNLLPVTFDGTKVDLMALMEDHTDYDQEADDVATVIVKEDLQYTVSDNVVGAIVYNFRGYDTMGESFVLITSVIGTLAILRGALKKKEEK